MPITWQNINAPSSRDVMAGLSQAQTGISGAFDKLSNLVGEQQGINQAAIDRKDSGLVLDLKTALSKATSLEQINDLTGKINEIEGSLQTNAGKQAVMGATDARRTAVMGQTTATNTFNDAQALTKHRAVLDQFQALKAAGRGAEADAMIANVSQQIPGFGKFAIEAAKAEGDTLAARQAILASRTQQDVSKQSADAATSNAVSQATVAQTGVANSNSQARRDTMTAMEHATKLSADLATKLSEAQRSTIGNPDSLDKVLKQVAGSVDKDLAPKVIQYTNEALKSNPEFATLPTAVVEQILLSRANRVGSWYNPVHWGSAADIKADLTAALSDPTVKKQMSAFAKSRGDLSDQLDEQTQVRNTLQKQLFPNTASESAPITGTKSEQAGPPIPPQLEGKPAAGGITAQTLPDAVKATLRLNNPPDSAAGRFEQRQFDQVMQKREKVAEATRQAVDVAGILLEKGDPAALNDFQATSAFGLLDKETKATIYKAVHGRSAVDMKDTNLKRMLDMSGDDPKKQK